MTGPVTGWNRSLPVSALAGSASGDRRARRLPRVGKWPAAVPGAAVVTVVTVITVMLCASLVACSGSRSEAGSSSATGSATTLPDAMVVPLDGGTPVPLRAQINRPTFVNLWASYCTPCLTEMPMLQEFAEQQRDRVGVIGVTDDPLLDKARELAAKTGVTFPLFQDDAGTLLRSLRVSSLPATVLVDAQGVVRWSHIGVVNNEMLQKALDDVRAESS